jgi:hypothetical protein
MASMHVRRSRFGENSCRKYCLSSYTSVSSEIFLSPPPMDGQNSAQMQVQGSEKLWWESGDDRRHPASGSEVGWQVQAPRNRASNFELGEARKKSATKISDLGTFLDMLIIA